MDHMSCKKGGYMQFDPIEIGYVEGGGVIKINFGFMYR